MNKVLVTGSSGFIGSHLVQRLKPDYQVYGLSRELHADKFTLQGDIRDLSFSVGDHEFDCVFHMAALTPLEKNSKKLRQTNVDGAKNLMSAIRDKTKSLIYASGLGVFGSVNGIIDEDTPYNPDTEFTRMRMYAQRHMEEECRDAGIRFSVAYFGDVYGCGGWFRELVVKKMRSGTFMIPGGGNNRKAFVTVEDAVGSLVAIYSDGLRHSRYVVADPEIVTLQEFFEYTAHVLGVKKPKSIPAFVAKLKLGGDMIRLLCAPTSVSNKRISDIYQFKCPGYRVGVSTAIENI